MLRQEKLPPVRLRSSNLAPDASLGAEGWAKRKLPPIKGSPSVPSIGEVQQRRDPAPGEFGTGVSGGGTCLVEWGGDKVLLPGRTPTRLQGRKALPM
ncbi:hypothetical protein Y1Q_0013185 [Alligator mississippiensis]|uniref:Uncharacterized protein n=1 Tax=Alligator mississippiensis TaxID=8496 RepID=A0A151NW54_ALLMI|nr:hypothetical protein Y1Q_0013185 [Alligator mississippiensis]